MNFIDYLYRLFPTGELLKSNRRNIKGIQTVIHNDDRFLQKKHIIIIPLMVAQLEMLRRELELEHPEFRISFMTTYGQKRAFVRPHVNYIALLKEITQLFETREVKTMTLSYLDDFGKPAVYVEIGMEYYTKTHHILKIYSTVSNKYLQYAARRAGVFQLSIKRLPDLPNIPGDWNEFY